MPPSPAIRKGAYVTARDPTEEMMRRALIAVLVLIGLGASSVGAALAAEPSGAIANLPLDMLDATAFADFRAPGLALLGVGLVALAGAAASWRRAPTLGWVLPGAATLLAMAWVIVQTLILRQLDIASVAYFIASFVGFALVLPLLPAPPALHLAPAPRQARR